MSLLEWRASQFVIREQRTWLRAVDHVQKAYPDTKDWLLSCSSTEGAWGPWVPNRDGYPPGGWLQFYYSTWERMYGLGYIRGNTFHQGALQDLEERGFTLREPKKIGSWYSPVGQALAGAWGVTHGRRGEWTSSGC